MQQDYLATCPKCGCDGCYITPINETKKNYYCWGCGYQTNDLMVVGEFDFLQLEENLPELYKDIKYIDEASRVWYPIVVNVESKGTVFINGKSEDAWQWAAIKAVPLTEAEKKEPKYKGASYKSDAKSLKEFKNDFLEACDYINLFTE